MRPFKDFLECLIDQFRIAHRDRFAEHIPFRGRRRPGLSLRRFYFPRRSSEKRVDAADNILATEAIPETVFPLFRPLFSPAM